mmetsp:Transcript_1224/g.2968  ORF Transcript_1224/g.2968 Transcript_1224/m.2968 type:complete len:482 (+) Transcript_1224:198-1643(+)
MAPRLTVLGGGVSGLSACFTASRLQRPALSSLRLVDSGPRPGGWFWSEHDAQSNITLERGPHSFRPVGPSGASAIRLVEELGLEHEAVSTSSSAKNRYIWYNNKLRVMPTSIVAMLKDPMTRILPWAGVREALFVAKGDGHDESVYDFFSRRFGPYVAETFADPLLQGIFAGDIRRLSVQACLPVLAELEAQHGSVVRAMVGRGLGVFKAQPPKFDVEEVQTPQGRELVKATGVSFPGGLGRLSEVLVQKIRDQKDVPCEIRSDTKVMSISRNGAIGLDSGEVLGMDGAGDKVISALPMRSLARILPSGTGSRLRKLAEETPYASVGVVNLAWEGMEKLPVSGFGHLVPTSQVQCVIGMIYDSEVFPSQFTPTSSGLTVMMGGMQFPEVARYSEEEMIELALAKVQEHLGISQTPTIAKAVLHRNCIPQYTLNHKTKVAEAREELGKELPFLRTIGNNFDGVGIADSIAHARRAVRELYAK